MNLDESRAPRDQTEHHASVREEYSALTSYFGRVISFRFTTLGFFLTAVALVVRFGPASRATAILILGLGVGLWIVELRTRTIFRCLGNRGAEIELLEWRRRDTEQGAPLYCRMFGRSHDQPILTRYSKSLVRCLFASCSGRCLAGRLPHTVDSRTAWFAIQSASTSSIWL